jgi:hypothetical protein
MKRNKETNWVYLQQISTRKNSETQTSSDIGKVEYVHRSTPDIIVRAGDLEFIRVIPDR